MLFSAKDILPYHMSQFIIIVISFLLVFLSLLLGYELPLFL